MTSSWAYCSASNAAASTWTCVYSNHFFEGFRNQLDQLAVLLMSIFNVSCFGFCYICFCDFPLLILKSLFWCWICARLHRPYFIYPTSQIPENCNGWLILTLRNRISRAQSLSSTNVHWDSKIRIPHILILVNSVNTLFLQPLGAQEQGTKAASRTFSGGGLWIFSGRRGAWEIGK